MQLYIKPFTQTDISLIIPGGPGRNNIPEDLEYVVYDEFGKEIDVDKYIIEEHTTYTYFKIDGLKQKVRNWHINQAIVEQQYIHANFTSNRVTKVSTIGEGNKSSSSNGFSLDLEGLKNMQLPEVRTTIMADCKFNPNLFIPIMSNSIMDSFMSAEGGLYPGVVVMFNGGEGTMKSSNLLQYVQEIKRTNPNKRVLYVSDEMNVIEAKRSVTKYYPYAEKHVEFFYTGEYKMGKHLDLNGQVISPTTAFLSILKQGWDVVILDSLKEIQNNVQEDFDLKSGAKAENWIVNLLELHSKEAANDLDLHTTFLCIQQSTKGDDAVGSRRLRHMINGFCTMSHSKKEPGKRYMEFHKNRSGRNKIKLYYFPANEKGIGYDEDRYNAELNMTNILNTKVDETDEVKSGEQLAAILRERANLAKKAIYIHTK